MLTRTSEPFSAETAVGLGDVGRFWDRLGALLERGSTAGLLFHKLGPLAALRLRERGLPVPAALHAEQRLAAFQMVAVVPLLNAVRAGCEGPLVLMKGPEVALRYPGAARTFADLDLLVQDAQAVHRQLKASGFVEYGDPAPHHLCPLLWPNLPVSLEVHSVPNWPKQLTAPSAAELIGAAVPSALGVDGVLAPDPARHALLIAAHSWAHEPLRRLRDLVDAHTVAAEAEPAEVERLARSWRVDRLWRTTEAVAQAVFVGRPIPLALRLRVRHLAAVREPTVLENHLRRLLAGYGALPPRVAAAEAFAVLRAELRPAPEESWRAKLVRTARAFRDARMPLSQHELLLGEEATRGRGRNPREDVEEEPLS